MPMRPTPAAARYIAAGEPEPARADAQHAARLDLALPVHADLRHDQVAAVALDLLGVERRELGLGCGRHHQPPAASGWRRLRRRRRHDAQRVARLHRRLLLLQVADVLVVQIHVDEVPQPPLVGVEVLLQAVVAGGEVLEQLADGGSGHFHRLLLVGERPQRRRDVNRVRHESSFPDRRRSGLPAGATRSCPRARRLSRTR